MHICFVEIGYPRPSGIIGGAGTYVNNFAKELVKLGHKVTVICGKMENDVLSFTDGDIIVYPIISPNKISYYMGKIPYFRVFANSMNYLINGFKIFLLVMFIFNTINAEVTLTADEFKSRRMKLAKELEINAIAIFQGAPSETGYVKFRQYNEFYYLTGIETAHAYVLIKGGTGETLLYLPH